LNKNICFFGK